MARRALLAIGQVQREVRPAIALTRMRDLPLGDSHGSLPFRVDEPGQRRQPWVGLTFVTMWFEVEVAAAIRAQAGARLATQHLHRLRGGDRGGGPRAGGGGGGGGG